MNKLILWVFSKTKIGQLLDGKKTIIGAVFVILASLLDGLTAVAPMFPQYPWLGDFVMQFGSAMKTTEKLLNDLGLGFLSVGILHKSAKATSN